MKYLLIAMLMVFAVPASAENLPKPMLGQWCFSKGDSTEGTDVYVRNGCDKYDIGTVVVGRKSFDNSLDECTATNVIYRRKSDEYLVSYSCVHSGTNQKPKMMNAAILLIDGKLVVQWN
jgi:hypothetical protein